MVSKMTREFVKRFKSDLQILSDILTANEISISGAREIATASYHLLKREGKKNKKEIISFAVSNIDIQIDPPRHRKPPSVVIENRLLVDIVFKQECTTENTVENILNSIIENEIQFRVKGKKGRHELVSAWHFDRHPYPPANNSPCHPTYHFQFGGQELKEVTDKIDGVVILDTPRYFAPPMDPILAVDVLLSHFNGPKWHTVRNNEPRYVSIVRRAQARLWKPYFDQISSDLSPVVTGQPARQLRLLPNIL